MGRHWTYGMYTPTNDPKTWEYYVAWGTSHRRPIIYLTFPGWEEAEQIGQALMEANRRQEDGEINSRGSWRKC